ncbi:4-(cytidine 5'-diphospho)-2-C-methyl-D-erythritol kinase [Falsarthrobacter nasiphocae]|uniref:4-(cytidine 5'-diphospho)-2-C-methyl-D-erythritol kinase n=1 Tax=Falsarthrobacter nasiphocae TaxID=189863 RepID=UPI00286B14D3|nr:4-(cytidine 5'-diphospho)-2-C-methyl-D-erythritol kinase [Falsarthrobacter nasiphocae]
MTATATATAPVSAIAPVTATAPGKINVGLRVGPAREDGYHSLASLFLAVSLEETVTLSGRPTTHPRLLLDAASDARLGLAGVPLDGRNLAARAVNAVADAAGEPVAPGSDEATLTLRKLVPIAGGMGGGSADAAAALVAANAWFGSPVPEERLAEMAATLGADVPFALAGGAAAGLGVGDRLSPVEAGAPLHWVLVPSERGLSTPEVFARLDELRAARGETAPEPQAVDEDLIDALRRADPRALAPLLHNDLQEAALDLAPELADALAAGREEGALAGIVSGSGPTLAFLADDAEAAALLARRLADRGYGRATAVHGPVPGARLRAESA